MSTMERLFAEIFDRKSRIERQLHQQFESYGESLACNVLADGRRPPPWLLELVPDETVCLDPGECRRPSSSFWNTERKTCSATWEFIQGTLPRDDSYFKSSIHDFVIAPTVDKENKSPHVVEEIHSACSRDEVRPTNLMAFESEILHTSQGAEKLFSYVDAFENKASETVVRHDGSGEGEEPSDALQLLYGCDIIGISDAAGFKSNCDETMAEFKGSNIELPYMLEDNILCKDDDIPSLSKERLSTSPHLVEEFLSVRSMDEVRLTNLMSFESHTDHTSSGVETLFSNVDTFENVIAPTVDKQNKSPHVVEEIHSACSRDEVRPTNLMAFESEILHTSQGAEKLFSYVDAFENKASESVVCHDGSGEGEEPSDAKQLLYGCDIIGISDAAGFKSSCDETMAEFKGSNIELPYMLEDNILCKDDDIPSLSKERLSTSPHLVEEFLSVRSMDEVRLTNLMSFESHTDHTSSGAETLFSNVDTFENKACERLVLCDVSEKGEEPYNVTQDLHRCDISGISDTAGVKSSCDETIPDIKGPSVDLPYTVVVNISNDAAIPSLPKELASATPHVVEEFLSVCSRDEVTTSNLIPCESEIDHTSHNVEKLFSHVDTFEKKASQSIDHHDRFEEGEEPYNATQCSYSCDVTISDIAGVKPSCVETMLEFEGSNIDLPYTLEDNIIFKDTDFPSLAKKRVSTTPHMVEILSTCSKDEVRVANLMPFESEIHHTSQCGVNTFENKAYEALGHHDGSEEGEEPYDAPDRCDISSISDTVGVKSCHDENMPVFEGFSIDLPFEEDDIVCKDADIPILAKERAFVLEQLRQSRIFLTPRSKPSIIDNKDFISNGFDSSPLGMLQNMDLGFFLKHNTTSSSINLMDMFCNNEPQLDGPAFESSHSLSSSSARFGSELQNLPLTPPAVKFSHGRLSGKRSSSSVKVSSNPELICFRIDENSSTTEENADVVHVGYSTHRASSRNFEVSTNSKPLSDVTSLYQNDTRLLSNFKEFVVRDSLESVNSDTASSLGFEFVGRESNLKNKENPSYTDGISESRNSTITVSKMSKSSVSCRSSDRIRNYQNIKKWCKPSNILSSISSFIPQIQQKQQQALPLQRKKDIKVKALEAAEAAKRLDDQMKIEREKRKAAVKLEREKLKQENAKLLKLKQNQKDEERRKKEDVAARKRQREAKETKVKDRKRRCIEETRTLQKGHRHKLHCEKAEKDIQQKAMEEKQKERKQRNNGDQKKLERRSYDSESQMAAEMLHCTVQVASAETVLGDDKIQALEASDEYKSFEKGVSCSNVLREAIGENVSATQVSLEMQSYEMSPYQTSDDEDMEEDSRRKKYIPRWARGDSLDEIILANQQLDPKVIFNRKRSFNVSQVLKPRVIWRRPLK